MKKSKIIPETIEEIKIKSELKALQNKRRAFVRSIDDLDTEMIGLKERLLYLKTEREKIERNLP